MWYSISTSEYAVGAVIDSEFLSKMRDNLNHALGCGNFRLQLPNFSFELTTGTTPLYWDITTDGGCGATLTTGCHGNYAMKLTKAAGSGVAKIESHDYIPIRSGGNVNFDYYYAWASSTAVWGGLYILTYDANYNFIAEFSTMQSSYASTPTHKEHGVTEGLWTVATNAKFMKVGFRVSSVNTTAGDLYVDAIALNFGAW